MTFLYFAYGSNLSVARLRARTPSARVLHRAALPGHALRFHKAGRDGSAKCDAFHTGHPAHCVQGVVFEIARAEKPVLDRHEGLGNGYEEKWVTLQAAGAGPLRALLYYATHIDPHLRPYHWYKAHVLYGAREHGLPPEYVAAVAGVPSVPDPDPARHARELAIYR